jgi:hypothetical protein
MANVKSFGAPVMIRQERVVIDAHLDLSNGLPSDSLDLVSGIDSDAQDVNPRRSSV